jgi:uncharacterized phage protein gp47/JayE
MSNNYIDGNGITIQTYGSIIDQIVNGSPEVPGLVTIYGADINVASNTPDGQLINIFALSKMDILELCVSIYDSFDPDQAVGTALDNLSQICGLYRKGGSYTRTYITMVTDRALTLYGLDTSTPFTISDNSGNQFYLINSLSFGSAGTYGTVAFQAADIGYVQVIPNTLTNIVTVTIGVATVNNPSVPYQIGEDQESDANFRIRRQKTVALPAQGPVDSLVGGLNTVAGLIEAKVYENNTDATNSDNVPAHSIWVIVDGGSDADVADMIYRYRSMGCGMYGTTSVSVTPVYGSTFQVDFNRANYVGLQIKFHVDVLAGSSYSTDALKTAIANQYTLGIYEPADVSSIITLIKEINPSLIVSSCQVYGTGWETNYVYPPFKSDRFILVSGSISLI